MKEEEEEEKKEDDSETRAHYPIVGSALADGVYSGGDSKSWPILRWESALRSTLIRLERSYSVSVSLFLSFSRPRVRLFPIPSCLAPHLLSFFPRCTASPSPYRSLDSLLMSTYQLETHTIKRERDDPLQSDCPLALASLLHTRVRHGTVSIAVPNTRSAAACISTVRILIRSEGNARMREKERGN